MRFGPIRRQTAACARQRAGATRRASPRARRAAQAALRTARAAQPAVLPAVLLVVLLAVAALAACGGPQRSDPVGTVPQVSDPVPSGPHLYCITNVGHTLTSYDLAARQVLPGTSRYLELDPVGPWFTGGAGYYISRVETSGAGANALIRFDPQSTAETGRLKFAQNSNPNSLLLLSGAHAGLAWVALRGSTFDSFATGGVSVVELATLGETAFCDLNADTASCARLAPAPGLGLTSPLGFLWDAACNGNAGCAYLVVNNFNGAVRDGVLLVLAPDAQGVPTLLDSIPLGRNPMQDAVLDANRRLWVVNNGGYVHFGSGGQEGTLQVLDPDAFANGTPGDETLATLPLVNGAADCSTAPRPDPGCDPTGIYSLDGLRGWVTTYPDSVLRTVDLAAQALDALDGALPRVTGPFFPASQPTPALFAAQGGLGEAYLGELDPASSALLASQDLLAGRAPLSCTEYDLP
jgi:hypothetical protein